MKALTHQCATTALLATAVSALISFSAQAADACTALPYLSNWKLVEQNISSNLYGPNAYIETADLAIGVINIGSLLSPTSQLNLILQNPTRTYAQTGIRTVSPSINIFKTGNLATLEPRFPKNASITASPTQCILRISISQETGLNTLFNLTFSEDLMSFVGEVTGYNAQGLTITYGTANGMRVNSRKR